MGEKFLIIYFPIMKAMILAAGYGSRLKPLTDEKPKALIEIQNIPLLELIIRKLIAIGISEIIINTHHLAEQIVRFVQKNNNFGIHIEFSNEPEILGTGGGLIKASYFFNDDQPFFLYNVDILATIDIKKMYQFHLDNHAMITLALQKRKTNRYFIVDENNFICGHEDQDNQRIRLKRKPYRSSNLMAFCGIHVISPNIFDYVEETGRFSIVDVYLKLIDKGFPIIGYPANQYYWKDIGKLETLDEINHDITEGVIRIDDLIA